MIPVSPVRALDVLPPMELKEGQTLGPYEILGKLGAGGMGEVYRARDSRLDRDVAIEVLPEMLAGNANSLARFEREAKADASLSHPNILAIHDFGKDANDRVHAVTELLEGDTLRVRLAAGALPTRKAVEIATQIALGLGAAHDKGVEHRDLKPENIIVTRDGRAKILDFGLAARAHDEPGAQAESAQTPTRTSLTEPGSVMGTVGYMSPEQVMGQPADARSDIFSFGAILYEMLGGIRAFQRETSAETMTAVLREEPATVEIPAGLDAVTRRCPEKAPEERFQSARDLAFALRALADPSSSRHSQIRTESFAAPRPRPWAIPALAALILMAGRVRRRQLPGHGRRAGWGACGDVEAVDVRGGS